MFKQTSGTSKPKPKSVSTKKDNKKPKYKAYHCGGSPIVKSVYNNYKTKVPVSVSTNADVSEWSTVGTFTPGTMSDWSEDEFDHGKENYGRSARSEQLRECGPSDDVSPMLSPPPWEVPELVSRRKNKLPRSPAVDALAELLGNRDKKMRLLPPSIISTSSSSEESDSTVDIFTSTVIQGGRKKMDTVKDISGISTWVPVDGGVSIQSDGSDSDLATASTSVLKSGVTRLVQETVDVEATVVKDVEPTKIQGDVRNESSMNDKRRDKDSSEHKSNENFTGQSPEDDVEEIVSYERSEKEDVGDIINKELSFSSPPNNSSGQRSGSKVVSDDTSGEIFSAVVHKNQVSVVVPFKECSYTPNSLGGKKLTRKLKLAHPVKVPASSSFHIFSPEQYYKGKSRSERLFDEFLEEEDVCRDLFD